MDESNHASDFELLQAEPLSILRTTAASLKVDSGMRTTLLLGIFTQYTTGGLAAIPYPDSHVQISAGIGGLGSIGDSGLGAVTFWPEQGVEMTNQFIDTLGKFSAALQDVPLSIVAIIMLVLSIAMMAIYGALRTSSQAKANTCQEPDPECRQIEASGISDKEESYSVLAVVALTSYRFYTGFLGATWMPFLVAKEGAHLWSNRQSFFMGLAKLIYGGSILLNPVFGLLGDQATLVSQKRSRQLWLIVGVVISGLGICGARLASDGENPFMYMIATAAWMFGEAMADTTTETLVPEVLPKSQYDLASAIRSLNFLGGGLAGYAALIFFKDVQFNWLYCGYIILMAFCAVPTLYFIGEKRHHSAQACQPRTCCASLVDAYVLPATHPGGFPRACLCLLVFSLGVAPIFFTMLMVRDIIGITEPARQQAHFSAISVCFLICAAISSTAGALMAKDDKNSGRRWRLMGLSMIAFGISAQLLPSAALFKDEMWRLGCFYVSASMLGLSFGAVYALFQSCTWSLLPEGIDVANAMGFAAMSKCVGVGIGNFVAGWVLDCYGVGDGVYTPSGYFVMCIGSMIAALASIYLMQGIPKSSSDRKSVV